MPSNLIIFSPEDSITNRLNYVLEWVFKEQLQVDYRILSDKTEWQRSEGLKINYSEEFLPDAELWIKPQGLLEKQGFIAPQSLNIQRWKRITVLFYNQPGAPVPFDLFAAIFYLISRYEEYLPFKPDKHGRFPESASVASQYHFLPSPVIDQWLFHFRELLIRKGVPLPPKLFRWQITYDIDMAWKYQYRGLFRLWGGHLRDLGKLEIKNIIERNAVLSGKRADPYFSFPVLEKSHQAHGLKPIFFFLLAETSKYDRNISGKHPAMQELIRDLGKQYELGIHPSYQSHQDFETLKEETQLLSSICQRPVTKSRQHFIKFTLPETYRNLIQLGIQEDYSMGYASSNGFRAGTSHPFLWYDLKNEEKTNLRVHPFAFMDATSRFYRHQKPQEALQEWEKLFLTLKAIGGNFTSIWHNYILSEGSEWLEAYEKALGFASEQK